MNRRCAAMLLALICSMPSATQIINITEWPAGQDALILDQPQTKYLLQADIATTETQGIIIAADGITLDGQGHSFTCESCTEAALQVNDLSQQRNYIIYVKNAALIASGSTPLAVEIRNSTQVRIEYSNISGDTNITGSLNLQINYNHISGKIVLVDSEAAALIENEIIAQGCIGCALVDANKIIDVTIRLNKMTFLQASGPVIRFFESTTTSILENNIEFEAFPGVVASGFLIDYPDGADVAQLFVSHNNISAVPGADTTGIINNAPNTQIYNNIIRAKTCIYNTGNATYFRQTDCKAEYEGIVLHYPSENAQILSNTIYANGDAFVVAVGENATAIQTRNNIFYSIHGYAMKGDFKIETPADGDYNDFFSEGHHITPIRMLNSVGAPAEMSLSQYQGLSIAEGHSIAEMPDFISDELGDLRIADLSPCVDAGDPSFGTSYPGSRIDIGAHEVNRPAVPATTPTPAPFLTPTPTPSPSPAPPAATPTQTPTPTATPTPTPQATTTPTPTTKPAAATLKPTQQQTPDTESQLPAQLNQQQANQLKKELAQYQQLKKEGKDQEALAVLKRIEQLTATPEKEQQDTPPQTFYISAMAALGLITLTYLALHKAKTPTPTQKEIQAKATQRLNEIQAEKTKLMKQFMKRETDYTSYTRIMDSLDKEILEIQAKTGK